MTGSPEPTTAPTGWSAVPGQAEAVARLQAAVASPVHAYLFVGPEGSGKRAALRAFAGELFAAPLEETDPEGAARQRRLAAAEHHPDLVVIEPEGAVFRGGRATSDGETEASMVIREAHRSPVEGGRKIVAADAFHAANDSAVGALLKTIEEPPPRTTVVLLAESVPANQAAIASRCVRVDFHAVAPEELQAHLGVGRGRPDPCPARGGGRGRQPGPGTGARHRRAIGVARRGLADGPDPPRRHGRPGDGCGRGAARHARRRARAGGPAARGGPADLR